MRELLYTPLSWLYGLAVNFRHRLFDWGVLKGEQFDIPIICIGNIKSCRRVSFNTVTFYNFFQHGRYGNVIVYNKYFVRHIFLLYTIKHFLYYEILLHLQ